MSRAAGVGPDGPLTLDELAEQIEQYGIRSVDKIDVLAVLIRRLADLPPTGTARADAIAEFTAGLRRYDVPVAALFIQLTATALRLEEVTRGCEADAMTTK
jgi:hypothetical protein